MKNSSILFFLAFSLLAFSACKEEPKWTSAQITEIVTQAPGGTSEVVMTDENTPISQCVGYGQRCVMQSGRIFKLGLVTFIAIEFTTTEDAWFAARELGQFYSRNWLFDDVKGEPSVETFVREHFGAVAPTANDTGPSDIK